MDNKQDKLTDQRVDIKLKSPLEPQISGDINGTSEVGNQVYRGIVKEDRDIEDKDIDGHRELTVYLDKDKSDSEYFGIKLRLNITDRYGETWYLADVINEASISPIPLRDLDIIN